MNNYIRIGWKVYSVATSGSQEATGALLEHAIGANPAGVAWNDSKQAELVNVT